MKRNLMLAAMAVVALGTADAAWAKPSAAIVAAVADKGRPAEDTARDADRKPAEMLEFAGVKPGQTVGDFLPGGGYFTRIFAKAVGPKGAVYAIISEGQAANKDKPPAVNAIAADANYGNVKVVAANFQSLALPTPADVIWTSQNYHDLHLTRLNLDVAAVNKAVFNALKPGGYYIVLDHAAPAGTPVDAANTLHRIDPAIVKTELEAAGFKLVGESSVLRNPKDDFTKNVFDPAVRGHTDQFIYKFQRPK
ncbi:class I SAM-dependent methyltransferase [Phenylobacterium aquaticum]|uniref:class I SAM-dependent methyltransferase n=1 Tax=Phenylobacterium aquaticum TaxID=1763816 RepID=UPI0026EC1DE9|nr:methyltransferase [Phenylobacterium aquaticum]